MKVKYVLLIIMAFCLSGCSVSAKAPVQSGAVKVLVPGQYLIPNEFGAKGDGKHDDTDALREALYQSHTKGKVLFIPAGKNYRVTGTLNYHKGKYESYTLNICGTLPTCKGSYTPGVNGGISVDKGVSVFKNASFGGSIENVCITGKRDQSVHLFDSSTCSGLIINGCNISNFGAIFYDTGLRSVSEITYNTFLTAFYFARNEKTSSGCTDSRIAFNYINGGAELNDNVCFEWGYFNGSNVNNNFIDYYRTVYQPKATKRQAFVGPDSHDNQYQVFRYLYAAGNNISVITFYSCSDTFNWVDPTTLDKLSKFTPLQYKGKDGIAYDYPPYIAICQSAWRTNIIAGKLEGKINEVIFVNGGLTEYEDNVFDVEFTSQYVGKTPINYRQGGKTPFYNNGKYMQNSMHIKGIVEKLDRQPSTNTGWSESPVGRTILYDGKIIRSSNVQKNGKWTVEWQEVND